MGDTKLRIKFVKEWDKQDIILLYKGSGWWKDHYDPEEIKKIIKHSYAFAVAINESGHAIGMGRIISDGVSDGYIQDLTVLPSYRKKGIGSLLLQTLIKKCKDDNIAWVALLAEPGTSDFYKPFGFKPLKEYTPMKLKEGKI